MAAILDFRWKGASWEVAIYTIGQFIPENVGVGVGILFLGGLEVEICLGGKVPPL
jgi:hypothetical protein